jgi:hypothetical protein
MNLRHHFQKIREVESQIADEFTVVVSLEGADGGRPDIATEVPRRIAARMIAEGTARLARVEERQAFEANKAEALRVSEQLAAASRVQFAVLGSSELERLRKPPKSTV